MIATAHPDNAPSSMLAIGCGNMGAAIVAVKPPHVRGSAGAGKTTTQEDPHGF